MSLAGLITAFGSTAKVPVVLKGGDLDGLPAEAPGVAPEEINVMNPDGATTTTYLRTDWFHDGRRIYQAEPTAAAHLDAAQVPT